MSDKKVDLNQATVANLEALPRIGKALARQIVKHREDIGSFETVAELADVSGVSDQMVDELEAYLFVQAIAVKSPSQVEEVKQVKKEKRVEPSINRKPSQPNGKQLDSEQLLQEFQAAARDGDIKKVKALIKDGVDGRDKFALIRAAENGHTRVVSELLGEGAEVKSKTAVGGTNALALAAQNGHLEVVQMLIEAGADVDEPAIEGWTPLMKAAYFGHDMVVQTLLEAGVEPHARNVNGKTAIDLARQVGNQQIVDLLSR